MTDKVVASGPAVIEQNTSGVVGVLAEALAQHQFGDWWEVSKPAGKRVSCSCEWVHESDGLFSWEAERDARAIHREHQASVVAALPNIAIVPDDAIIPGLGAELRGCIDEYLGGWASTDDAVQPLVGSYFAEGLSDLLSDQIGPILAAARAARAAGGQA